MCSVDDGKHAEEALRRSEAEYRSLFEAAGIGNAEVELGTGRFVRVNRRFCEMTGYTADELLGGMTFLQITHPEDRQRNVELFTPFTREQEGSLEIEKRYVRKDGSIVWVLLTATLIRDADGKATRLLGSAHDVTDRKRAEEALQAAYATLRHLVEYSPFGIYAVDADFRLVQVSAGAQKVFENVHPLLGRDFAEVLRCIWPEPFASEAIGHFRHTLQSGEAHHAPSTVERRRDIGELESYDWKIERLTLPDGRFGVVCHFYDLSERQRYEAALRESEQRFRTMADSSPVMIWVTNARGEIEFVNRAYQEFFGVSEQQLRGPGGWQPLVHPEDLATYGDRYTASLRAGMPFAAECRVRHADGSWRWVASSAVPRFSASGEFLGHVGSSPDITDRKRAEQALLEADRRKDEFLATLAHELRNPLAPLMNSVELLKYVGVSESLGVQARQTMERQLAHLVRLVDDLLDISRLTSGKVMLKKERVDVNAILREAVESCEPLARQGRQTLTLDLPPQPIFVHADPVRLTQVVGNLINNACKYTPADGQVWVTAARDGSDAFVRVRDNGIGIPPAKLHSVFEMFAQVDTALDRARGGLGIGLSLVKGLVEMHGGTVQAHSAGEGKGSEFVVRLPVLVEEGAPASSPPPRDRRGAALPKRILVVDDNRDTAQSMARLLKLGGHQPRTAHDGPEALEAAEQFQPDLVLLDIGLPSMSGYDVCRAIRRSAQGRKPVMIALTGWGQDEDRRKSAEAGFDHHLVKPIDFPNLTRLLDDLFAAPAE